MAKNTEETTEQEKRDRSKEADVAATDDKAKEKEPKRGGVGGNGNLIPLNQRTMEERRAIGTKAGVASGVARRRKKELREFTRDFLMQEAAPALKGNMSILGVDVEEMSNLAAMVTRMFSKAVNQGDLNAARSIIEWAGMAPLQQERENEAIAKMSQVIQLMEGTEDENAQTTEDVIFYIPENGRPVITDDELVTVSEET